MIEHEDNDIAGQYMLAPRYPLWRPRGHPETWPASPVLRWEGWMLDAGGHQPTPKNSGRRGFGERRDELRLS